MTRRAVIVGSGPNGLTCAARLATSGWDVQVFEAQDTIGGAAATAPLLGSGTAVDLGAAAHPFGVASPAFRALELEKHGLTWLHSTYPLAHPFGHRPAALLHRSVEATAAALTSESSRNDARAWRLLHADVTRGIDKHLANILAPPRLPAHPAHLAAFGVRAWPSATGLGRAIFRDEPARALLAGSAIHAICPPTRPLTAAFGVLFNALGQSRGWPVARGGSGAITQALASVVYSHGGRIHTGAPVRDLQELPAADAVVLNLTPAQVLRLEGTRLPARVAKGLGRWRYGSAVFKVDWLLDQTIPWSDPRVGEATTVHLCGSTAEMIHAEREVAAGRLPHRPFVMACQQQAADASRADATTVLWTYAHVPHGYAEPRPGYIAELIADQIERMAPGFRDTVVRRVQQSPTELERWNPNLIGGDIAGGSMGGLQLLARPRLSPSPYRLGTAASGAPLYLASGSTPPGAGVHGMAGWNAAESVQSSAPK